MIKGGILGARRVDPDGRSGPPPCSEYTGLNEELTEPGGGEAVVDAVINCSPRVADKTTVSGVGLLPKDDG